MKFLIKFLPFLVIVILSYWAIRPFFVPGFFPMHDDTQVARVFEMNKSLGDGLFPVRFVADLGYNFGYPLFNFYAPLAYYVGGLAAFFTDALTATKIMMVLGVMLAGVFMYLFAKEFWGRGGGLIATLLYLYAPYHALDMYVRGDVAEFWAYAFIPLLFYGLWKAYKERTWTFVILGSLGYAGIILSHNLTGMMVTPFALVFGFFLYLAARSEKKLYKPYYPLLILLIGILLSAFYWLPVFGEMKYTNVLSQVGGGADYKDHFVCPIQLWDSPWGFGGSTPTCVDGLSFKIGKAHIVLFFVSLISVFFLRKNPSASSGQVKFWFAAVSVISLLVAVFLTLAQSRFIWDSLDQMAFLQYPWRFLIVVSFFISFLGGSIIFLGRRFISSKLLLAGFVGFVSAVIIYVNHDAFFTQTVVDKTASDYTNDYTLRWTTSIISDEYMPKNFIKPRIPQEVPEQRIQPTEDVEILSLSQKTQEIKAQVKAKVKTDMLIKQAYFPGWHVFI